MRIGHGFDVHRLVEGRDLVLGGVYIPYHRGLEGHSDGDVLLHAITSAVLGALGEGDLGRHFPSENPALGGVSSRQLLARATEMMEQANYRLGNLDTTVVAQEPRLAPFQNQILAALADAMKAPVARVNVKITSTDQLGAIGRGEGIAAFALVLMHRRGNAR